MVQFAHYNVSPWIFKPSYDPVVQDGQIMTGNWLDPTNYKKSEYPDSFGLSLYASKTKVGN